MKANLEKYDLLTKRTKQLKALVEVASTEDFQGWSWEIKENFMWVLSDIASETAGLAADLEEDPEEERAKPFAVVTMKKTA